MKLLFAGPSITQRVTLISLIPVYGNGLVWCLAPLLGWGRYAPEPFGLSCSLDWPVIPWSYTVSIFSFCYGIPMLLMLGCYGRIVVNVRNTLSSRQFVQTSIDRHVTKVSLRIYSGNARNNT